MHLQPVSGGSMKQAVFFCLILFYSFLDASPFSEMCYKDLAQCVKADTAGTAELKSQMISRFPASRETWEYAHAEFYDSIFTLWKNPARRVPFIDSLLITYPHTSFRRILHLHKIIALKDQNAPEALEDALAAYRQDFPQDYQSFYLSAKLSSSDLIAREVFANNALILAKSCWKPAWTPPLQWQLEYRSASMKATRILAEILTRKEEYSRALDLIQAELDASRLTTEDEETYASLYLAQAKIFAILKNTDSALDACIHALIEGDSRNRFMAEADSLLHALLAPQDLTEIEIMNLARTRMHYTGPTFEDATAAMGLADITAGRVAWGDFDADGFDDLLLGGSRVFKNRKGREFQEVTQILFPDTLRGNGGIWADFDNDGQLDVVTKDPESLWLNRGGMFEKILGPDAFTDNGISSEGLAVADLDRDGFLDIYVANYENWQAHTYLPDEVWRGRGNGRFYPITDRAGLLPEDDIPRAGRGVNPCDFDGDGDIDIYVSNYRLQENYLFENDGTGHFENSAQKHGIAGEETDGWWGHTIGSEWGDYDADGDFDLITANLAHPRYIDFSNKTKLYQNQNGHFTDVRATAGISYAETHSEPSWGDFDNDGYLDLLITCVYPNRPSVLYHNNGDGTFTDISWLAGIRHRNGWGAACADVNNDGRLDVCIAGGQVQMCINTTQNDNNWLEIRLQGSTHGDAVGAQLLLKTPDFSIIREVQGGKGTTNQHSMVQHFGLGLQKPPYHLMLRNGTKNWFAVDILKNNTCVGLPVD